MQALRMLEGELLAYNGVVWVVKGFQHPRGYIIAYPRYSMHSIPATRLSRRSTHIPSMMWSCIGRRVPVVPADKVLPIVPRVDRLVEEFTALLRLYAGIPRESLYATGSRAVGIHGGDIDVIVYGGRESEKAYRALESMRREGVTKPLHGIHLAEEHRKHCDLSLLEYGLLRRNSLLQGVFRGVRYSVRLVPFSQGAAGCIEPARPVGVFNGVIEVVEQVSPYTTPAVYRVRILSTGRIIGMATFRIRYSELPRGMKLVVEGGVLERTSMGLRIVPDHGRARPIG